MTGFNAWMMSDLLSRSSPKNSIRPAKTYSDLPFIFSFKVKLPWIFFSSASMVSPPMSASRWVRFTMPMPKTMSVTCWGSELTKLRRRPPTPGGLFGVVGSCCSFSKITLQSGSEGRRPPSGETKVFSQILNEESTTAGACKMKIVCLHGRCVISSEPNCSIIAIRLVMLLRLIIIYKMMLRIEENSKKLMFYTQRHWFLSTASITSGWSEEHQLEKKLSRN